MAAQGNAVFEDSPERVVVMYRILATPQELIFKRWGVLTGTRTMTAGPPLAVLVEGSSPAEPRSHLKMRTDHRRGDANFDSRCNL
jgi:hypothetical protein